MTIEIPMKTKFEELKQVLENIKKDDKILIICDNDGDGIPAAAIFAKILKNFGKKYKKDFQILFANHDFRFSVLQDKETQIYLKKFNYIFLLDTSLDDYSFLENVFICVIDHHKKETKANLVINPMFDKVMKNKPNCSTGALSYCAYRYIFGDDFILQKIGFTASIYDYFLYGSLPYLNVDKYNLNYFTNDGFVMPDNYSFNEIYSLIEDKKFGSLWIFEKLFFDANDNLKPIVLLPNAFYKKLYKKRLKAKNIVEKLIENIVFFDNCLMLTLPEKYENYKADLNFHLRAIYLNKSTFIFFENKKENGYMASCRSHTYDLIELANFLKINCKTFSGGGHIPAIGFFIKETELKKCKSLIMKNIAKFKLQ